MKKCLSIVLCCVMLLGCVFAAPFDVSSFVIPVSAADYFSYTLNSDKASYTISDCSTIQTGVVTIPDYYNDYPVTEIGNRAFSNCTKITEVVIGNNVKSIGSNAFESCTKMTKAVIGDNVKTIGREAFYGCTRLTSVTLGTGVQSIGSDAFYSSFATRNVYISDLKSWLNISFIDEGANPAKSGYLYINGDRITEITIPDGITAIKSYAFYACKGITSVTINDSVTTIGDYAFSSTEITNIALGDGVKTIKPYAFSNMKLLESIAFNENIESIEDYAFNGCSNLNKVYISDLSSWLKMSFSQLYNNPLCFGGSLYCDGVLVDEISIPDGVTEIKNYAFYGCSSIVSVNIPASVKRINSYAFNGCTNLKNISLQGVLDTIGNEAFSGTEYYNDSSKWEASGLYLEEYLLAVDKNHSGPFAVKKGTVCIADYAAYQNTGITHLVLSDSVEHIGSNAFDGCKGITEIVFGENLSTIGNSAFYNCTRLDIIRLNNNLKEISSNAFYNCSGLSEVYVDDLATWCDISFSAYSSNPVFYARSLYVNNQKITDLVIPEGVTTIRKNAFYNLKNINSISIPASVKSIEEYAFYGCSGSADVYISDLAAWCNINFEDAASTPLFCKGDLYLNGKLLDSVYIPEGVEKIKAYAFCNTTGIASVVLPATVTEIEKNAFGSSDALKSLIIPETVTKIDDAAFNYSSNITIYCYENSFAHTFCQTKSIPFVLIHMAPVEGTTIDYENKLIFTSLQAGKDIADIVTTSADRQLNLADSGNTTGFLNTADVVGVYENGNHVADYTVIVKGDVNADGVCDVLDVASVEQMVNALEEATLYQAYAANNGANDTVEISTYQNIVNTALDT